MKALAAFCIVFSTYSQSFGQGGWRFDTDPSNDFTKFSTSYSYVGASFVEINGDEFVDIFVAPKSLFYNNGDGTFTRGKDLAFTHQNSTAGSSCADLDNDGDNDLIVSCLPSKVYFNDGNGNFKDSSSKLPSFSNYGSWAVAIGDYNKDRELDFIFAHANGYHPPSTPSPCKFYIQKAGSFNPILQSDYSFSNELFSYTCPTWSDYDLDGDMDLFIASGPAKGTPDYDYCFKNLKVETGKDSLEQMTNELFAKQKQDGQCYNFIDFDNDCDLDLCLSNYLSAKTRMYKNTNGIYTELSTPFTNTTTNISNCWGDYDNDGDMDVIITNDNQTTKYYQNNGIGSFTYLNGGFTTPTATNGIANGDYDNDGDLDIITNGVGNNGNTSSVGLYINDTVARNRSFINLKLTGVESNRSGIGAFVKLHAIIYGKPVWQIREVSAQNTFQGQNDIRVHFGLGDATAADSIIIIWPSGKIDRYYNYAAHTFYNITEGFGITNVHEEVISDNKLKLNIYPAPSDGFITVNFSGNTGSPIRYTITDISGKAVLHGKLVANNSQIEISGLCSGMYFLNTVSGSNRASSQFLKK